jgi:glycosyltransferase involved in cell wall biosynthesis
VQSLREFCHTVETVPLPRRSVAQRAWTTLTSPQPDMAHRLASVAFQDRLRRLLAQIEFDVVEFEGLEMMPYLSVLRQSRGSASDGPWSVFDDHNAEYVLQKRVFEADAGRPLRWPGAAYSFIQWQKLRHYEAWACRHVDAVAAVSSQDGEALRRIVPGLEVTIVPNGVDITHYASFNVSDNLLSPNSLVFTGKMDFRPNVDAVLWFVRKVLPLIRDQVPEVLFYVVGQRPHRRLEPVRGEPGVVITGRVPDPRPYIGGASVYIVPLRSGGGTRLKVLEAMAMRRAIVSTPMGCDGFPVTSGRELSIAPNARSFAREVIDLLRSPERRAELGRAGFAFARAHYDWAVIVPQLEAAYRSA